MYLIDLREGYIYFCGVVEGWVEFIQIITIFHQLKLIENWIDYEIVCYEVESGVMR